MSPHFDPTPSDFSRPGRVPDPQPGRQKTHELERPGAPEPGRSFQEPARRQQLAVAFICLAVGVVGLICLFAGWLS